MTPPMSQWPVFRQVLTRAEQDPGKTAIVSAAGSLSWGELGEAIRRRAGFLTGQFGVQPGDRIALLAESDADFVTTYFAVHSIGAVSAPLDPHMPGDRLAASVQRLAPKLVVSREPLDADIGPQARYGALAAGGDDDRADTEGPEVAPEQTADILLTTGTTAESKAVVLSHRALAVAAAHINRFIQTRVDAVEVLPLALHHSFGLGRVRCVLSLGATLVLVPGFLDIAKIIDALAAHRATGFASVPSGMAMLLRDGGSNLSRFADRLEYLELGSSAMPIEQKHALMKVFPKTRICMHYGLTEASRSAFLSFHDDRDRLGSIGRPSPGVEMRVVDSSGRAVDAGETGEIEIRGPHLMTGYWRDPERTARTLRDGWLRTGDVGHADTDGYLHLEARVDDVINVGGRKVLPQEIEQVLLGHPAVADCACVGIPDPQGLSGQIISAWLVPKRADVSLPAFSELAKLTREKLEPYKTPRRFRWTEEIPKSPAGKVLRNRLRDAG